VIVEEEVTNPVSKKADESSSGYSFKPRSRSAASIRIVEGYQEWTIGRTESMTLTMTDERNVVEDG
jgi:hypothetical protein